MDIKELSTALTGAVAALKESQNRVEAEAKKYGEASAEAVKRATETETQVTELAVELKELRAKHAEFLAERERLNDVRTESRKSLGEIFTSSEAYEKMLSSNENKSAPVKVGSFFTKSTLSTAEVGSSLVQNDRQAGLIIPPDRQLRLRDLMTVAPTDSNAIEYVRETGYFPLRAKVTAGGASGSATVTVDNSQGFYVGQKIIVGAENKTVTAVNNSTNVITVNSNFAGSHAVGTFVTATYFGATTELELKPLAGITYDLQTESVKTLAHGTPASRQILADARQLRARIDDRLRYGLKQNEEEHILYGDGTSKMLSGILTDADRQTYSWSTGATGDSKIDALRRAMTLARLAEYPVDGIVMHPSDWEDVVLAKGSNGHYIWANVVSTSGVAQMWAVPVVETTAIRSGTALVGAFGLGATLYDREQATIRVAEEHSDYFMRNMVMILAEERLALTVERPEAFVHVTFDSAPA